MNRILVFPPPPRRKTSKFEEVVAMSSWCISKYLKKGLQTDQLSLTIANRQPLLMNLSQVSRASLPISIWKAYNLSPIRYKQRFIFELRARLIISWLNSVVFSIKKLLVMTRRVHCLTLSRDGRTDSDFGKLYSRVNTRSHTNVIRMTDSVNKVN